MLGKVISHEQLVALVVEHGQVEADGNFVDQAFLADNFVEVGQHGLEVGQALHLDLEADTATHVHHLDVYIISPSQPRA